MLTLTGWKANRLASGIHGSPQAIPSGGFWWYTAGSERLVLTPFTCGGVPCGQGSTRLPKDFPKENAQN